MKNLKAHSLQLLKSSALLFALTFSIESPVFAESYLCFHNDRDFSATVLTKTPQSSIRSLKAEDDFSSSLQDQASNAQATEREADETNKVYWSTQANLYHDKAAEKSQEGLSSTAKTLVSGVCAVGSLAFDASYVVGGLTYLAAHYATETPEDGSKPNSWLNLSQKTNQNAYENFRDVTIGKHLTDTVFHGFSAAKSFLMSVKEEVVSYYYHSARPFLNEHVEKPIARLAHKAKLSIMKGAKNLWSKCTSLFA